MSEWRAAAVVLVLIVLAVGLFGPAVFTWKLNQLADEYDRLCEEDEE